MKIKSEIGLKQTAPAVSHSNQVYSSDSDDEPKVTVAASSSATPT
jgi:hypothetical protein